MKKKQTAKRFGVAALAMALCLSNLDISNAWAAESLTVSGGDALTIGNEQDSLIDNTDNENIENNELLEEASDNQEQTEVDNTEDIENESDSANKITDENESGEVDADFDVDTENNQTESSEDAEVDEEDSIEEVETGEVKVELTYQTLTKSVDNNNVSISGNIPEGAEIEVTKVMNLDNIEAQIEAALDSPDSNVTVYEAFDIKIIDADGQKYQPVDFGETVNVNITNVKGSEENNEFIMHISDDGSIDQVAGSVNGTTVDFTASSFSVYAVASVAYGVMPLSDSIEITVAESLTDNGDGTYKVNTADITIDNSFEELSSGVGKAYFRASDGLLVVTEMGNVTYGKDYSWYEKQSEIVIIKFKSDLTKITRGAFTTRSEVMYGGAAQDKYNGELAYQNIDCELVLPDSIVTVESAAFLGISGFKGDLIIPQSTTLIGESSFGLCTGFDGILSLGQVQTLQGYTFYHCENLKGQIKIPDSVTDLGLMHSFNGCSGFDSLVIGKNIDNIPSGTFNDCSGLKEVNIPDNITVIGAFAFQTCKGIETLNLGEGVRSIGYAAFNSCSSITGELKIPDSTTGIGYSAFYNCPKIIKISGGNNVTRLSNLPNGNHGTIFYVKEYVKTEFNFTNPVMLNYDWYADNRKKDAFTVTFNPNNGEDNFTQEVEDGSKATIPETPTKEGYVFGGWFTDDDKEWNFDEDTVDKDITLTAKWLIKVIVAESVINDEVQRKEYLIDKDQDEYIQNPYGEAYLYRDGETLIVVDIPKAGATSYENYPWSDKEYASKIQKVRFNIELKNIYEYAFSNVDNKYSKLGNSIIIPDDVLSIGNNAFDNLNQVDELYIGKSVSSIGANAFYDCGFENKLKIRNSVKSLGKQAFHACKNYTELEIENNSITIIETSTFEVNTSLQKVTIGNSVKTIGQNAFQGCTALNELNLGSVVTINAYAFMHCESLPEVNFPDTVQTIRTGAFDYCTKLVKISGGNNVTTLDARAFYEEEYTKTEFNFTNLMLIQHNWLDENRQLAYTVTFDVNGGTPLIFGKTLKVEAGKSILENNHAYGADAFKTSREGYKFLGWRDPNEVYETIPGFDNGEHFDIYHTPITKDITLVAHWEKNECTITFNTDGGSYIPPQTVQKYGSAEKPADPTKKGYVFEYWERIYPDGSSMRWLDSDFLYIEEDITLKAIWKQDDKSDDNKVEHKVSFDTVGGDNKPDDQTIEDGEKATEPDKEPTKPGFKFKGWKNKKTNEPWDFDNNTVDEDVELIADWVAEWTVTFETDGGTPKPAQQKVEDGEKAIKPQTDPTREGFKFLGWKKDKSSNTYWDFNKDTINENIILYADWLAEYTVSFDTVGGNPEPEPQTVEEGGHAKRPTDPKKTGFKFKGWKNKKTNEPWDFEDDPVTGDTELVADWEELPKYTVSFDTDGGTPEPESQTVPKGEKVTKPTDPKKPGFKFRGWKKDKNSKDYWDFDKDIVEEDTELIADWVVEYSVEFDANGGTPNPAQQKVGDGEHATKPQNPTRKGFKFLGWEREKESGVYWDFNKDTVTENIILYAAWEEDNTPEPTPTPTPDNTPEPTPTPTPDDTPEPTPTPTPDDTPEPTPTPDDTTEPTPTPDDTPEPTPTPENTPIIEEDEDFYIGPQDNDKETMMDVLGRWMEALKTVAIVFSISLAAIFGILGLLLLILLWLRRVKVQNDKNKDEYQEQKFETVYKTFVDSEGSRIAQLFRKNDRVWQLTIPQDIIEERVTDDFKVLLKKFFCKRYHGEQLIIILDNEDEAQIKELGFVIDKEETEINFNYAMTE